MLKSYVNSSNGINFLYSPPLLTIDQIEKMTNKKQLRQLEKIYDDFLEKNFQILLLYNIADKFLDIRDALTIRILRVIREEKLNVFVGTNILLLLL